jgi:serine/threonine protein kinase
MSETFCPHCGGVHEPAPGPCSRPPLEGRTLPDGLRVLKAVGPVSLGVLYRAEDPRSPVELDLVFLHPGVAAGLRSQFSRAAAIRHPNVAAIRAVGETPDGVCYVAFEVLRGQLLSEILQARHILPLSEAADLALQAAAGLQAVHQASLLHGNLSPETILVAHSGNDRPLVKLVRFGLMQHGTEMSAGGDADTRYAAPERLAGHPPDERSDVFSLGAVLHHLLTGSPPSAVPATSEPVPDAEWSIIANALDPLPERRFPTAAAFAEALTRVGRRRRAWPWNRGAGRQTRAAGAIAAGLRAAGGIAAGLIVALGGLWLIRGAQRSEPDAAPVEAATARDTETAPDARERATSPSARVDTAPGPPRESRRRPATMPSGRPQPKTPAAHREPTAVPPESLALEARLREPLKLRLPPIVVAPPADTAVVPAAAVRANGEAATRAAVGRVVATYARALESNDLRAVEWAYPELTERERQAWKKFFSVARDLVVTLDIERYAIAGSEADVDVRGTYRYWNRSLHRSERAPVRFLATLKRRADGWRLTAIR